MAAKEYLIPYSADARKRHHHIISRGKVNRFMVQLEIKLKGKWEEVIRYDCAHGYAHQDSYNRYGQHKKTKLHINFNEALTLADDDIDENWETYRGRFLEGDYP